MKRKRIITKTFDELAAQLERIYRLYLTFGCGTKKMLERAEAFMCDTKDVGLCF